MFGRIGASSFRHRWWVTTGWLLLTVLGVVVGGQVFDRMEGTDGTLGFESGAGLEIMEDHATRGGEVRAVIDGRLVVDPELVSDVRVALADLRAMPDVAEVTSWYDAQESHLQAMYGDATATVVQLDPGLSDEAEHEAALRVRDRLHALGDDAGVSVTVGGEVLSQHAIDATVEQDLIRSEMITMPLALIALLFVFRGFLAAVVPLLTAVVTVSGSLLMLLAYSRVGQLDENTTSVVTMLGLGLAIDYGLLIVNRFREERWAGGDVAAAVEHAAAAAGRSVAFSAVTVAVALSALYLFGDPSYSAMASAGIAVAVMSGLAAMTLTPALLGLWGGRIRLGRRPGTDEGLFARVTRWTQRRPLAVVAGTAAVLLLAGAPALDLTMVNSGPRLLPPSFETRQLADLDERFPGAGTAYVLVVAEVPSTDPAVTDYVTELSRNPDVRNPELSDDFTDITVIGMTPHGKGDDAGIALVEALRADRPEFPTYVTGDAAYLHDYTSNITSRLPAALALMAFATMVLLFLMTGSVLVPVKAIIMNVLSLGASFGAIVLIFQHGIGAGLLGTEAMGGIESWVPMLVFVFAFGLSMDYEVFLISRIKELHDQGHPNDEAVVLGVQRTGRIITSAALLICLVFAGFAAGQMVGIKEFGVALTIAVIVDATIVRMLLVPAAMSLLGDRNWWAPEPLRRLHARVGLGEPPARALSERPVRREVGAGTR